jgi:hypothetical protein
MTDWIMAGVLGVQTIVLIYASAKLQKISRMMDRLTVALTHIAEDIDQAIRDMRTIQDDMTELEDFIKTALRESK